jgi:hypothetical protein
LNLGAEGAFLERSAETVPAAAAAVGGGGAAVGKEKEKEKEKHSALSWFSHRDIPLLIESLRAPVAALSASVYTYMYSNTHAKAAAAAATAASASAKVEGVTIEESEGGITITAAP